MLRMHVINFAFGLLKKEVLLSEARVLGLGPIFMSIYIQELAFGIELGPLNSKSMLESHIVWGWLR